MQAMVASILTVGRKGVDPTQIGWPWRHHRFVVRRLSRRALAGPRQGAGFSFRPESISVPDWPNSADSSSFPSGTAASTGRRRRAA